MKPTLWYSYPALAIVCILIYFPVLNNEFMLLWDDQWMVINRYTEGGFTLRNLWAILSEFYNGQYAPVSELLYLSLYTLFGYNPACFHAAGLLIHIANVLLIYVFICKFLALSGDFGGKSMQRIAFVTALLVAVHPLNVEPVAWISAFKIILYVLFYLCALLCYLRYIENPRPVWYLFVILFFFLSFGAKEQAAILPVCLLLLDYFLGRNLKNKDVWIEKLPFFLLALFFGMVTLLSQAASGGGALSSQAGHPLGQRIIFGCYSYIEYLVKFIFPVKLSYLYPFPNQPGEPLAVRFLLYPTLVVIPLLVFWRFWSRKWIAFGILFFTVHLALALHIIPLSRFAIVADRYAYISLTGAGFIVAYLLDMTITQRVRYRKALVAGFALFVLYCGIYAHTRTYIWHDSDTLKNEIREMIKERDDYDTIWKQLEQNE